MTCWLTLEVSECMIKGQRRQSSTGCWVPRLGTKGEIGLTERFLMKWVTDTIRLNLRKAKLVGAGVAVKEIPFKKRVWEVGDAKRDANDNVVIVDSTLSLADALGHLNYAEDLKQRASAKQDLEGTKDKDKQRLKTLNWIMLKNRDGVKDYTDDYFGLESEAERIAYLDTVFSGPMTEEALEDLESDERPSVEGE